MAGTIESRLFVGATAATGVRVTPTAPIIDSVRRSAARRRLTPPSV